LVLKNEKSFLKEREGQKQKTDNMSVKEGGRENEEKKVKICRYCIVIESNLSNKMFSFFNLQSFTFVYIHLNLVIFQHD
jgi:hypothetical protein